MHEHKVTSERVRDFQPPWRTVRVYACPDGTTTRVRVPKGGFGPGAIIGNCGQHLRLA